MGMMAAKSLEEEELEWGAVQGNAKWEGICRGEYDATAFQEVKVNDDAIMDNFLSFIKHYFHYNIYKIMILNFASTDFTKIKPDLLVFFPLHPCVCFSFHEKLFDVYIEQGFSRPTLYVILHPHLLKHSKHNPKGKFLALSQTCHVVWCPHTIEQTASPLGYNIPHICMVNS